MAADRVANKIALVTGAAAGLGRAIAARLSEEGASLVLADIDAAGLAETEHQIKASGRPEIYESIIGSLELDVSKAASTGWRPQVTLDEGLRLASAAHDS